MESLLKNIFNGPYTLEREISSPCMKASGGASFKKLAEGRVLYEEGGSYQKFGEQIFYQRRLFIFQEGTLSILKENGDLLHYFDQKSLLLNREKDEAFLSFFLSHIHFCGSDTYAVEIKLLSREVFHMGYHVRGPHKNYHIKTIYTR